MCKSNEDKLKFNDYYLKEGILLEYGKSYLTQDYEL